MYKNNSKQLCNNKNIKTTRKQKCITKKELQQPIKLKNDIEIKLKNNQYRITQENLKNIITDFETETAQKNLNNITEILELTKNYKKE